MSEEVILIGEPTYWESVWSQNFVAQVLPGTGDRWVPIEPVDCPFLFESHILAVLANVPNAKPRWRLGVKLRQLIEANYLPIPLMQGTEVGVPPNRGELIVFPRITQQYRLQVWFPWWHKEVGVTIFQYVGPHVSRVEENLQSGNESIRVDLARIEQQIRELL
jgi:hypothetical protein